MNDDRAELRSRDDVDRLVRSFYRDAAMDDLLGPVFAPAARSKLVVAHRPAHKLWCWQLLGESGYAGNPLRAHLPVHGRTPFTAAHFERWLELFTASVDHHFRGPTADMAKSRATKMATALRRLLAGTSGRCGDTRTDPPEHHPPPSSVPVRALGACLGPGPVARSRRARRF